MRLSGWLGIVFALAACTKSGGEGSRARAPATSAAKPSATTKARQAGSGHAALSPPPAPQPPLPALPCFKDAGQPAGDAISLKLTTNHVTGVAPLAVFFDTGGTTAKDTSRTFHELSYCWDFGDPKSGSFSTDGLSKNQAHGPVSGHVFETAGKYSVTVSARDAHGRTATRSVEVVAADPNVVFAGKKTVCLATSNDFSGCPAGAVHVTDQKLGALRGHVAQGTRLLLQRGSTFQGRLEINVPGPGLVGAFGPSSAPRPVVRTAKNAFDLSDQEPSFSDWRIMDIEVVGQSDDAGVVYVGGTARDLLILRVKGSSIGLGVGAASSIIDYWNSHGHPGHDIIDGLTLADMELTDLVGGKGHNFTFITARRLLMLGNRLSNSTGGEHVARFPWIDRGVMSSNDLGEAPEPRHVLKIHAPLFDKWGVGKGQYTHDLLLSDNVFRSTGGHDWTVAIGPQNAQSDERVKDVLVERNLFLPGPEAQVALLLWGRDITVRDNILHRGPQRQCIAVGTRGIEPAPERITLLHNTCYSEAKKPALCTSDGSAKELTAYNNLIAGPNATGTGFSGPIGDNAGNLLTQEPGFSGAALATWKDFELSAKSPAVDAALPGHATPWDFTGRARPVDGNGSGTAEPDIGALERAP